jgi:uncharacterized protein YggE
VIVVTGTGRAGAEPDVVRVRLAISVRRPSAAAAVADADAGVRRVRAALAAIGVPAGDTGTQGLSVNAQLEWNEQVGQRITGFQADHEMLVTLRDMGAVGRVLGELLAAGGDDVRLHGVDFAVEDDEPLLARAREAAWWDALARANQLATLTGRRLGAVEQVVESGAPGPGPGPALFARDAALAVAAVDVRPGSVGVEVTLSVRWAID